MLKIVGVKFQEWGKVYYYDAREMELEDKDRIIIETDDGLGLGIVKLLPAAQTDKQNAEKLKKVVRKANEEDLMQRERNSEKENTAFRYCGEKIASLKLNMKLVNVEYLFDGSKATFYFTAEERVDFRELVKDLANHFHTRIELRQIGVRDEARIKGGIGPCGRRLCCSTWINSFEPVSVKMAKVQKLSLNPSNISGMCGRLMCCLSYEYQNYISGEMASVARQKQLALDQEAKATSLPFRTAESDREKVGDERAPDKARRSARNRPETKKRPPAKERTAEPAPSADAAAAEGKEEPPKKGKRSWKRYKQKRRKKGEPKKDA